MKFRSIITASLLVVTFATSQSIQAASTTVNWGYYQHGETPIVLPDSWAEHFPNCNGSSQSPVDISKTVRATLSELDISYEDTPLHIINNGHTIEVEYEPGSSLYVADEDQRVLQFHFHTPSENVVNGKQYPMEMHIVHSDTAGALTVVAVFIEEGQANETFGKIINNAPIHEGQYISPKLVNVDALLPSQIKKFFNYTGSLTTPPCSEGVNWIVMKDPITFSAQQITAFEQIMYINNRPLQATNGRTIYANKP
ncbi:MAG: carbonic anhydrase [Gammaproteobacteria bacterium]